MLAGGSGGSGGSSGGGSKGGGSNGGGSGWERRQWWWQVPRQVLRYDEMILPGPLPRAVPFSLIGAA